MKLYSMKQICNIMTGVMIAPVNEAQRKITKLERFADIKDVEYEYISKKLVKEEIMKLKTFLLVEFDPHFKQKDVANDEQTFIKEHFEIMEKSLGLKETECKYEADEEEGFGCPNCGKRMPLCLEKCIFCGWKDGDDCNGEKKSI